MNRFKNWLFRFFSGRYGTDSFGYFLLILYAVLCIINAIFRALAIQIFTLVIAFYYIWRVFSRNYYKRSLENRRFLSIWNPIKTEVKLFFDKIRYSKTSRFRKCKHCKAILKLPNKKGKHSVRCPKCSNLFDVKI